MKIVEVSKTTYFVRHWFKWYRVTRGGLYWDKLPPIIKRGKPEATIDSAAQSLKNLKFKPKY